MTASKLQVPLSLNFFKAKVIVERLAEVAQVPVMSRVGFFEIGRQNFEPRKLTGVQDFPDFFLKLDEIRNAPPKTTTPTPPKLYSFAPKKTGYLSQKKESSLPTPLFFSLKLPGSQWPPFPKSTGEESSNGWNNAGTGHSALCEPNYTPEANLDGTTTIPQRTGLRIHTKSIKQV